MNENDGNENNLDLNFYLSHEKLTKQDKEMLEAIKPIAKAVSLVFGNHCEVVLHSLEDPAHSVILIENPKITARKLGSPLTDLGIRVLMKASQSNSDVIGSYFTKTKDNKTLKSITAVIKNLKGIPIGMFCINIDISAPFLDYVKDFIPDSITMQSNTKEQFITDINEFIEATLHEVTSEIAQKKKVSIRERNQMIIGCLYQKNVFNIKGAVEYIAEYLGLSKYTVYSYIRSVKNAKP
jgi:predicted transcriptional regulator YheO